MGEIDREADDFYIPRQAMEEILGGYLDLSISRESIFIKLIKIFVRFIKFLWDIFIVLVPLPTLPANGKSR